MVGCRVGAKNTLLKNYLWFAERLGVEIRPDTQVADVRPLGATDGSGGYVVATHYPGAWLRPRRATLSAAGGEGEASHGILLLSSGSVQATGSGGVSFRAGPGFALGALEAVGQVPRWYEAQALTPVVALQGQTDVLVDLFEDSFEMATDYLAVVARATLRVLDWSAAQAAGPRDG